MTLVIKPGVRLRQQLPADAEADAYIAAVEAADGQALEPGVKFAINNFVLCCKQDGIWNAIKASCILAGARTLNGALVPLVGNAPTNFNFVAGDYNRKTGLVGDGSTKYLNSNRNNNADPRNSCHNSVFYSTIGSGPALGPTVSETTSGINLISASATRNRNTTADLFTASAGFVGTSRNTSTSYLRRNGNATLAVASTSFAADGDNILLFRFAAGAFGTHRLSFYSIGESLDLALLDSRVTDLMNAIGAAIP